MLASEKNLKWQVKYPLLTVHCQLASSRVQEISIRHAELVRHHALRRLRLHGQCAPARVVERVPRMCILVHYLAGRTSVSRVRPPGRWLFRWYFTVTCCPRAYVAAGLDGEPCGIHPISRRSQGPTHVSGAANSPPRRNVCAPCHVAGREVGRQEQNKGVCAVNWA